MRPGFSVELVDLAPVPPHYRATFLTMEPERIMAANCDHHCPLRALAGLAEFVRAEAEAGWSRAREFYARERERVPA